MKILHIISSPAAGGAEMYVKDLSISMAKAGNTVSILFISHAKEIDRSPDFESEFLNELKKNNIEYDFIGNSCKKNPIKGIIKTWRFAKLLRPDVIHSHLYYGAVFSLFASKTVKVYTHHNIDLLATKKIYKVLDFGIDTYIGICKACQLKLEGVTKKRVIRINNGVDIKRIKKIEKYTVEEPVKILMAGRLTEQKNYQLMINSLTENKELNFHVKIAGEGPEREKLERMVEENELSSKVTFLGNCNNIRELMAESNLFVMSSQYEGLPIALIEATLAGLPVLVTDVGGCSEIVQEVCNGIVVHSLNESEFSFSLRNIIENKALRLKFHDNALSHSKNYTIDAALQKHLKVYTELLRDKLR